MGSLKKPLQESKPMNSDLIADIWSLMSEHLPEKVKKDVATELVTTLLDYGVSEQVIEGLFGIDTYLDAAVEYAIDENGEGSDDYNEEEEEWD